MIAPRPNVTSVAPCQSRRLFAASLRLSWTYLNESTITMTATGRLMKKTQRHDAFSTNHPPRTGPITRPTAPTIVLAPIATPSCPRGKASVTSAALLLSGALPL